MGRRDQPPEELLTYMMEDPRNITACIHLLFCAKNLERIGDHVTNIAEYAYFMMTGSQLPPDRPKVDETINSDDGWSTVALTRGRPRGLQGRIGKPSALQALARATRPRDRSKLAAQVPMMPSGMAAPQTTRRLANPGSKIKRLQDARCRYLVASVFAAPRRLCTSSLGFRDRDVRNVRDAARIWHRHRLDQPACIGVRRVGEDLVARAHFEDLAQIHDRDAIEMFSTTAISCEMNR